jgi:lipopolysaccharide transport system permease protein
MMTKIVELTISFAILACMMVYYKMVPTVYALWVPVIIFYTMVVALTVSFFGAAMNVYYRDVSQALPVFLSLLMYGSPVMYPLNLVYQKLIVEQAAGKWSNDLYTLYLLNPLAGIIDSFQRVLLKGLPPDYNALYPDISYITF